MDESHSPLLSSKDDTSPMDDKRKLPERTPIGVLGTGDFATALTRRLVSSGHRVVVGSRKPSARRATMTSVGDCLCGAQITTIDECLRRCDVIIVAIHMENFSVTLEPFAEMARGKIMVDVSNRESRYASRSNADYLSQILPKAEVVKAFNTVSAHAMENEMDVSVGTHNKVFVASNDKVARNVVLDMARSMGFQAVDFGGLKNAIYLEDFILKVFPHWKVPIFLTFGIFNVWSLYIVYIYFIDKTAFKWEQIFLKILNKPLCMTAMTVLALTYLPGQIASIVQVYRGTKHSRFPRVLDTWLKSRKQFGLIAFFLVSFHAVASTAMLSPTYYRSWFHQPAVTINASALTSGQLVLPVTSSWMVWKGELAVFFGISAFLAMCIQAVTSIEAVANVLNWSEWKCVQSSMGTAVLFLASCHVVSMGAPGWAKVGLRKTMGSITFLSLILPVLVLLMKFVFRWSPLFCYLKKIRRGWERSGSDRDEMKSETKKMINKGCGQVLGKDGVKGKSCCASEDTYKLNIDDVEDESCCSGGRLGSRTQSEQSSIVTEGQCRCSGKDKGRKSHRENVNVRFAINNECDCSAV